MILMPISDISDLSTYIASFLTRASEITKFIGQVLCAARAANVELQRVWDYFVASENPIQMWPSVNKEISFARFLIPQNKTKPGNPETRQPMSLFLETACECTYGRQNRHLTLSGWIFLNHIFTIK